MLGKILRGAVDLLYPKTCVACKKRLSDVRTIDNLICANCWGSIKKNTPPFCPRCGRHLDSTSLPIRRCSRCANAPLEFDRAFSACAYDGTLKELIHQFKYRGKDYLGRSLSRLLVEFTRDSGVPMQDVELVVPMPLSRTKQREREFNQAQVLASHVALAFDKQISGAGLRRHRHTPPQAELADDAARFANVKDSFSLTGKSDIIGKRILLVDDVLTTGATCSEAARALKTGGAGAVFVLTLAH